MTRRRPAALVHSMRYRVLALLATVLLGCSPQLPGQPGLMSGSVSGTVTASPCRPVERLGDPPCPPVPGVAVDFTGSDSHTVTTTTDATGGYLVTLPPGSYSVRVRAGMRSLTERVAVGPGQAVTLNLVYDSGIR